MTGRNDNGILVNNSSSQQAKLFVDAYRTNFTYPNWFENTLGYAESGQITVLELQKAADNLLNQGLMKPKPSFQIFTGNQKQAIDQRIQNMYGDDIEMLHGHASDLGTQMDINWDEGQKQRDRIDAEIIKGANERQLFHDMHLDQETRISTNAENIGKKADKSHTHPHKHKNGDEKDCGWFGEKCWFPDPDDWEIPTWLKLLGAALGIGLFLWLIRPLLKIGANVTK